MLLRACGFPPGRSRGLQRPPGPPETSRGLQGPPDLRGTHHAGGVSAQADACLQRGVEGVFKGI